MTPIRVLLADDEPLARRRIARFARAEPDVEVVAECEGGAQAVSALAEHEVDLVLLDVQMPDLDGFAVVDAVGPERMPPVIFVTAYDEHAVRAFEMHALDYLLKPVTAARFRAAFGRARAHLEGARAAEAGRRLRALLAQVLAGESAPDALALAAAAGREGVAPGSPSHAPPRAERSYADRLTIKADGRVYLVKVLDVDWFEAHGNYVRVHVGQATHLIRETISGVEALLDPTQFARIHRGTIVNMDRIRELQPWFAGDSLVILRNGAQLKLSRTYREALQARLRAIS